MTTFKTACILTINILFFGTYLPHNTYNTIIYIRLFRRRILERLAAQPNTSVIAGVRNVDKANKELSESSTVVRGAMIQKVGDMIIIHLFMICCEHSLYALLCHLLILFSSIILLPKGTKFGCCWGRTTPARW